MNYKHVISFLGREQQKMWAKPMSVWVSIDTAAGGGSYSSVWNENLPIEKFPNGKRHLDAGDYPEFFQNFYGCWGNNKDNDGLKRFRDYTTTPSANYPQFYNADSKSIMFINSDWTKDKELIFDFVDKNGGDMVLDRSYSYEDAFVKKAFLATRQQKDWTTSRPEWILANKDNRWTEEIKPYLKDDKLKTPKGYLQTNTVMGSSLTSTPNGSHWSESCHNMLYYNPDKDLSIAINKGIPEDRLQALLEAANQFDYPLKNETVPVK